MKLQQIRPCDGKCCEEKPRFPDRRFKVPKCKYLKNQRCQIKSGERTLGDTESPAMPGRPAAEVFQETCVDWPQNSYIGRDTGGCCWQWVDDGD